MSSNQSAAQMGLHPLPDPPPSNAPRPWHCLQLYESDAFLAKTVSHFIAKGLQAGEGVVVIATEAHREVLERQLMKDGVEFDQARTSGQYVYLDANETLARFMVSGWPDLERYDEVIGEIVAKVTARYPRIRVFGEMVALLWAAGQTKRCHLSRRARERIGEDLWVPYPLCLSDRRFQWPIPAQAVPRGLLGALACAACGDMMAH